MNGVQNELAASHHRQQQQHQQQQYSRHFHKYRYHPNTPTIIAPQVVEAWAVHEARREQDSVGHRRAAAAAAAESEDAQRYGFAVNKIEVVSLVVVLVGVAVVMTVLMAWLRWWLRWKVRLVCFTGYWLLVGGGRRSRWWW